MVIISLSLTFLTACLSEKQDKREVWQVKTISSNDFFVKPGMTMKLTDDTVSFTDREQSVAFRVLKSKDRLVMETGASRLLFRIELHDDSILLLHELYSPLPLTISFTRTINQ